jgi:hypothetical protein
MNIIATLELAKGGGGDRESERYFIRVSFVIQGEEFSARAFAKGKFIKLHSRAFVCLILVKLLWIFYYNQHYLLIRAGDTGMENGNAFTDACS